MKATKVLQIAALTVYGLALSGWSASVTVGGGGSIAVAVIPVAGWIYALGVFGLWNSDFALLVALWAACAGVVAWLW